VGTLVFTGGASRDAFGCKLLADVLGRTLLVPDVEQPAAIGGAVLVAGEQVRGEQRVAVYEPDPERAHAYVEHGLRYRDAYSRLQEAFGK
jgi:sugar (pentulose or hexulose) kinase